MLGLRSPKKLVMFLVAISLTLLSAAMLAAQTPTALLDKPAAESSAALPDAPSKVPATPVATAELPKPAENIVVPEAAPLAPPPLSIAPPMQGRCPAGSRAITADVVAIPQPIMLNR